MQEVKAYKSNSGHLYDTEEEAKVKDIVDNIIKFMTKDEPDGIIFDYSGLRHDRRIVIEELSLLIVKDAAKFRAIFEKIP